MRNSRGGLFSLWKKVRDVFFILVHFTFICNLLLKMLKVGLYFVINGFPTISCFISIMWKIYLRDFYTKVYFVPLFGLEQGITEFFHILKDLILVLWLFYLR